MVVRKRFIAKISGEGKSLARETRVKFSTEAALVKEQPGRGALISEPNRLKKTEVAPARKSAGAVYLASGLSSENFPLAAGAITRRRNALTRTPSPNVAAIACSTPAGAISSAT